MTKQIKLRSIAYESTPTCLELGPMLVVGGLGEVTASKRLHTVGRFMVLPKDAKLKQSLRVIIGWRLENQGLEVIWNA